MNKPGGKGDKRRPQRVDEKELERRWRMAFGTTKPKGKQRDINL